MVQNPYTRDTIGEHALIVSLEDPAGQERCQIQTALLADIVDRKKLPWCKFFRPHSQVDSKQGGTMESAHSCKVGDWIMVCRPYGNDQDYVAFHGAHPGTIANNQSGGGGSSGG